MPGGLELNVFNFPSNPNRSIIPWNISKVLESNLKVIFFLKKKKAIIQIHESLLQKLKFDLNTVKSFHERIFMFSSKYMLKCNKIVWFILPWIKPWYKLKVKYYLIKFLLIEVKKIFHLLKKNMYLHMYLHFHFCRWRKVVSQISVRIYDLD